ncbi:carbon-nitrogen family hydrolase [Planctomycetota bacterium]
MDVVGLQLDIVWEDKATNYDRVHTLLQGQTITPGSLLVLPEMFATGFSMNTRAIGEANGGETEQFLQYLAGEYQSYVLGGLVRQPEAGKAHNEAVVFNDAGAEVARYHKLHPFSFAGETEHYDPGTEIVTFAWQDFTVGLFICYDLRFPEVFRAAVARGVNLFVVVACWPAARQAHWTALLMARAIENQAYVVGVNRCGADPKLAYAGASCIIGPRGDMLAEAGDKETTLQAALSPQVVAEYRASFPCLHDIRRDYQNL